MRQTRRPHFFQFIEIPYFGAEHMNNYVTRVDQHPVGLPQPFDLGCAETGIFDFFHQMVSNGAYLSARSTAGDQHIITKTGLAFEIDGDDVDCLVIVERILNDGQQMLHGRHFMGFGNECLSLVTDDPNVFGSLLPILGRAGNE